MGASSGDMCPPARNRGSCNLASENLMTTGAVRPPDRRLQMTADPVVLNIEWTSRGGPEASWLYRRGQTDYPDYLDRSDVDDDEWAKWHADRVSVDKILARAGMFHGVEASAVRALTAFTASAGLSSSPLSRSDEPPAVLHRLSGERNRDDGVMALVFSNHRRE